MSDFLSSPFSLVTADLAAGSSAGESASLTLDKKRDSLESKLHIEHRLKKFLVSRRMHLENQGRLQNEKELEILGKDFKKQMKENRSLTLKLCQKEEK